MVTAPLRGEKKTLTHVKPAIYRGSIEKPMFEPKHGGLEDDFPSQLGDFYVPAIHFQRCRGPSCTMAREIIPMNDWVIPDPPT